MKKAKERAKTKIFKSENGITLIVLVVTIVVLLILAGVTISAVFSENGIIKKAQEVSNKTTEAVQKEKDELNQLYNELASALNNVPEESNPPESTLPSDGSYSEEKGVNTPNLGEGMTAIKWDETRNDWIETNGSDPEWYNYGETESTRKWANAKTSDGSMWVWIPRYAYSITSGYHSSTAGNIEIEFMKGLTNETSTGRISFRNASGQGNWNIHPAFNYGETISGIWVAKFEASRINAGSNNTIKIQPGVTSGTWIDIGNMYIVCKNYNSSLNSHLIKNDEWGAVAYLSKSKYGKNGDVDKNDNGYTGGGSGNAYVTNVGQSTTGTVYGVYDMSGGNYEYVAAYVNNGNSNLKDYGQSLVNGDAETKNVYNKGNSDDMNSNYSENSGKYGDAIYETSVNGNSSNGSWYDSYSDFPYKDEPFFLRGGSRGDGRDAGVFYFDKNNGTGSSAFSFRPILVEL